MFKLLVLAALVSFAAAQAGGMARLMMMMSMMGNQGGAQTSPAADPMAATTGQTAATTGQMATTGGGMGGLGSFFNNPALLCRQTEGFRPIPCRQWRGICNVISMQTYNMPGLLKCSPMGFGCCLKDMFSAMMVRNL